MTDRTRVTTTTIQPSLFAFTGLLKGIAPFFPILPCHPQFIRPVPRGKRTTTTRENGGFNMYLVNNRIPVTSEEHLNELKERFQNAPQSMKSVPGFVSFRLLKAEDGSHLVAETVFETKQDFINWTQSEHFRKAHGGRRAEEGRPDVSAYEVLIP
jgi:heme-degrading monooxygenase HmoA